MNIQAILLSVRHTVRLTFQNSVRFFLLFLAVQTSLFLIFVVIAQRVYRYAIMQSGFIWVTYNNQLRVFSNWKTLVLLLLLGFFLVSVYFLQECMLYFIVHRQSVQTTLDFSSLLGVIQRIFSKQYYQIFLYVVAIIFPTHILLSLLATGNLQLPQIIQDIILYNYPLLLIIIILLCAVLYLYLRLLFTTYCFVSIQNISFVDAMHASWELTSRKYWQVNPQSIALFFFITFTFALDFALKDRFSLEILTFGQASAQTTILPLILWLIKCFSFIVLRVCLLVFPYLYLIHTYYNMHHNNILLNLSIPKRSLRSRIRVLYSFLALCFVFLGLTQYFEGIAHDTLVIAHRGDTTSAIENSFDALYAANKKQVDYVEVDIQATKDNQYVLYHDYNIYKLSGINKTISELTFTETQSIVLRKGRYEAAIPSLNGYIATARILDQPLLLDIKTIGTDRQQGVQDMLAIIDKYHFLPKVMFQSQNHKVLEEIKKQAPDAIVGIILTDANMIAHDDPYDFYAVNRQIVDLNIYRTLQKYPLYAWTLNDRDAMQPVFDLQMAAIITDDIPKAMVQKAQSAIWSFPHLFFNIITY